MRVWYRFGAGMALALASAGTLVGQDSAAVLVPVSEELRFTSITTGGGHSCALTAEGKAYCWGRNDAGQLGDSTMTERPTPVPVAGGLVFRAITAGAKHTCALTSDADEPYCWGSNEHGQLGTGGRLNLNYPFRIAGTMRFVLISAGGQHTCATQHHWERQDRIVCWGSNEHGQLGTLDNEGSVTLPTAAFGVIKYASITTGDAHTCGATTQGKVFCWGGNDRGQLGNASATLSRVPFIIRMNQRATYKAVAAGTAHSCGLTSEGEIFCWGDNLAGQVGSEKGKRVMYPTALRDTVRYTALTAGGNTTCALKRDGTVSCWGSNTTGQFGTSAGAGSPVPTAALPGTTLTALSLGRAHGCGLRPDGSAVCWGRLGL